MGSKKGILINKIRAVLYNGNEQVLIFLLLL